MFIDSIFKTILMADVFEINLAYQLLYLNRGRESRKSLEYDNHLPKLAPLNSRVNY